MKNYRFKVAVVSFLIVLVFSNIPASGAANLQNTKCPKIGKISTIENTKYICTKTKTKFVWKKLVNKATPTTVPTKLSPEDLKLEQYFNEISKLMDNTIATADLSINIDSKLQNSIWAQDSVASIKSATKLLQALGLTPKETIKIYISWGSEYRSQYLPSSCNWNSGGGACGPGQLFADLKWFADNGPYGGVEKSYFSEQDKFRIVANVPHELAHLAQIEASSAISTNFTKDLPAWLREGAAEYFKFISYAYENKMTYKRLHDLYAGNQASKCLSYPLSEITGQGSYSHSCEYTKGLFAVEYMILKFGSIDSMFSMNKTAGNDMESKFQKAYGISQKNFEEEADRYFAQVIANAN